MNAWNIELSTRAHIDTTRILTKPFQCFIPIQDVFDHLLQSS